MHPEARLTEQDVTALCNVVSPGDTPR